MTPPCSGDTESWLVEPSLNRESERESERESVRERKRKQLYIIYAQNTTSEALG